jgi:hypothetical protein
MESDQGHELYRGHLLNEYQNRLDEAVAGALQEQAEGTLMPVELAALQSWQLKQASLLIDSKRAKQATFLLARTGFLEKAKQRVTALTPRLEKARVETAWRAFDKVIWLLANGHSSVDELSLLMREAGSVQQHREAITILQSDQIPVWLKPQAEKVLQKADIVQKAAAQTKNRTRRKSLAAGVPQTDNKEAAGKECLVKASGNPANERWRVSFIARQRIDDYMNPHVDPTGLFNTNKQMIHWQHTKILPTLTKIIVCK